MAKKDDTKPTYTFKNSRGDEITTHSEGAAAEMRLDSRFEEVKTGKQPSGSSTASSATETTRS